MKRTLGTTLTLCATLCLTTPSTAQAQNNTCPNADYIFLGEAAQYFTNALTSLYFKTRVTAGRSYAVIAWAPFQSVGEGGASLTIDIYDSNTCTTVPLGVNLDDNEPFVFGIEGHTSDHDNIIPATNGIVYIKVSNTVAAGYSVHVLVIETTLFSPWWFVGGTNQAFIEIRNNMSMSATAEVTMYQSNGVPCGSTSVNLPGNGNTAVAVRNFGSCSAAVSGSAQIAFAGTPGGMTANITTIDAVNGTSFDAPFSPRMVWATWLR